MLSFNILEHHSGNGAAWISDVCHVDIFFFFAVQICEDDKKKYHQQISGQILVGLPDENTRRLEQLLTKPQRLLFFDTSSIKFVLCSCDIICGFP